MEQTLNLGWLWPGINNFTLVPETAVQLSAWFVGFLLVVTVGFLGKSIVSYFRASMRVSWLKKQLQGLNSDTVTGKRPDIEAAAEKKGDAIGHLWLEFDETLVEVKKGETVHLYNILDASHFFNSSTLAKGVTENRLIAAVPGFLTAIGVIGTFVGLQLGLSELNISSDVSVDEMKLGVTSVINGAKIAFLTSVWGVSLSVIFNFIEKFLEQSIRSKIGGLQVLIDNIFPRLSAESQLQDISENSFQSKESLQGLAERIGEKMQESLIQATQGIQQGLETSLEKIMAPAINKLVDETSEGNQKALEDLLGKFMEGFGQQGAEQRESMESASERVNEAVTGMNTTMEAFVRKLEASQDASSEREKELISTISLQVSQLVEQSNEQGIKLTNLVDEHVTRMGDQLEKREAVSAKREAMLNASLKKQVDEITEGVAEQSGVLTKFVNDQITGLVNSIDERDKRSGEMDQKRNDAIGKQAEEIGRSTSELVSHIEASINNQQQASEHIIQQGKSLQQSVESSVHASAQATQSMKQSAEELRSAADSMNVFSSHIRDAGNKLSGAITEAVESTKDLASQNQLSSERMDDLREQLLGDIEKFDHLSDQINAMIQTAGQTFTNLKSSQAEFLTELKRNVGELSNDMSQLLSDYAEQANSQTATHLRIWADSSTQYAEQMNSAARALSSVVDEIEDKVS